MNIQVRETTNKGRGVFALVAFAARQHIEEAPVLAYPAGQRELIYSTVLSDYPYDWTDGGEAIAMGFGSFYNHSYKPNAWYRKNFERRTIDFIALRPIAAGEEITINYNGLPNDLSPLWFTTVAESAP
jgi:hypothetical protein